jgi:limonene-1,2-epoxide hydrolase
MTDRQSTIRFFEQWGVSYEALMASFYESFSRECRWEQRPLAITTGPDEAVRFLARAHAGMGLATIDVELRNVMAAKGVVFTERVDHLRRADGALIVSAPVTGVMEWQDGQLVAWREYFDSASFVGKALPRLVSGAAQRVVAKAGALRGGH